MTDKPIIVHACHCTWCKRETGTAFAHNAVVETARVELLEGEVETTTVPSESGKGQDIVRCPACHTAVWGHYASAGPAMAFVRVGTLDDPAVLPPDIHVFTSTKLPWVVLPEGVRAFPEFYNPAVEWAPENLARARAARGG
jgi:hypothetical protein